MLRLTSTRRKLKSFWFHYIGAADLLPTCYGLVTTGKLQWNWCSVK